MVAGRSDDNMPLPTEKLIRELEALSKCPLDLSVFDGSGMEGEMDDYWLEVAEKHDADLYDDLDASIDRAQMGPKDMAVLTKQRDELAAKITSLREDYSSQVSRFFRMSVATSDVQKKHFTKPGDKRKTLLQRTHGRGTASLFYPEVDPHWLRRVAWDVLEDHWRTLLKVNNAKFFVDVMEIVGASGGKETELICLDFDFSTPQVHGYPVLETDKPTDAQWCNSDVMQGTVTPRDP